MYIKFQNIILSKGIKNIGHTVIGSFVAFLTIYFIEDLGHVFFPLPKNFDSTNHEHIASYIRKVPAEALTFPLASYLMGGFTGGFIGNFLSKTMRCSLIIGFIISSLTFLMLIYIPHPLWFNIVALLLPLPASFMGGMLSKKLGLQRINEQADI